MLTVVRGGDVPRNVPLMAQAEALRHSLGRGNQIGPVKKLVYFLLGSDNPTSNMFHSFVAIGPSPGARQGKHHCCVLFSLPVFAVICGLTPTGVL